MAIKRHTVKVSFDIPEHFRVARMYQLARLLESINITAIGLSNGDANKLSLITFAATKEVNANYLGETRRLEYVARGIEAPDVGHSLVLQKILDAYNDIVKGVVPLTSASVRKFIELVPTCDTRDKTRAYRDYVISYVKPPVKFTRSSLKGKEFIALDFASYLSKYLSNRFVQLTFVNPYLNHSLEKPDVFVRTYKNAFSNDRDMRKNKGTNISNGIHAFISLTDGTKSEMSSFTSPGYAPRMQTSTDSMVSLLKTETRADVSHDDFTEYFTHSGIATDQMYIFNQFYFAPYKPLAFDYALPASTPFLFCDSITKKTTTFESIYSRYAPRRGDPLNAAKLEEACDRIFVALLKSIGPHPEFGGTENIAQWIVRKHGSLEAFGLGAIDKYL